MRRVALAALAGAAAPFAVVVVLRLAVTPACACGEPPGLGQRVLALLSGTADLLVLGAVLALAFAAVRRA